MAEQRKGDVVSVKAAQRYREEQISGLSQKELVLMLYDGAIKFAGEAKEAIGEKDYMRSYTSIVRARSIVTELLRIVDMERGGEIAKNLQRFYIYMIGRLTEVNFTKEIRPLDNVLTILQSLRAAWAEIDFEQALANEGPDNGQDGLNGRVPKPDSIPQPADEAAPFSLTA